MTAITVIVSIQKALVTDLEVTRELCVQLDKSKESLSTQLSTCTLHYDEASCVCGSVCVCV